MQLKNSMSHDSLHIVSLASFSNYQDNRTTTTKITKKKNYPKNKRLLTPQIAETIDLTHTGQVLTISHRSLPNPYYLFIPLVQKHISREKIILLFRCNTSPLSEIFRSFKFRHHSATFGSPRNKFGKSLEVVGTSSEIFGNRSKV